MASPRVRETVQASYTFKRSPTVVLQVVVALIGIGALAFMLWEPRVEGRNAHAGFFEIYFKDSFVAYAYLSSIPFFMALSQAFKVLGYVGRDKTFSPATARAVRTIRHCAIAIVGFVAVSIIFMIRGDPDDRPAGTFMRLLVAVPSVVTALAAGKVERLLRDAALTRPTPG